MFFSNSASIESSAVLLTLSFWRSMPMGLLECRYWLFDRSSGAFQVFMDLTRSPLFHSALLGNFPSFRGRCFEASGVFRRQAAPCFPGWQISLFASSHLGGSPLVLGLTFSSVQRFFAHFFSTSLFTFSRKAFVVEP